MKGGRLMSGSEDFKLVEVNFVDMYHFKMWEGKFQDLRQAENDNEILITPWSVELI